MLLSKVYFPLAFVLLNCKRLVNVSDWALRRIKCRPIICIQGHVVVDPPRQVGVGYKVTPKGNEATFLLDSLLRTSSGEASSDNEGSGLPDITDKVIAVPMFPLSMTITEDKRLNNMKICQVWVTVLEG